MFVGKVNLLQDTKDALLHMQLEDLAKLLSRRRDIRVETGFHALYDEAAGVLTVSQFWRDLPPGVRAAGWKSDVYLRAFGSAWFSDAAAIATFMAESESGPLPVLARQLFALGEDMRLTRICREQRPGMARVFAQRHEAYAAYYRHPLRGYIRKREYAEALLLLVYGWFTGSAALTVDAAAAADASAAELEALGELRALLQPLPALLERLEAAASTGEAAALCRELTAALAYRLGRDAAAPLFATSPGSGTAAPLPAGYRGPLPPARPLADAGGSDKAAGPAGRLEGERLPMWSRESADRSPGPLRFELERGRPADAFGGAPRAGDATDAARALTPAQGRSRRAGQSGAAAERRYRGDLPGPQPGVAASPNAARLTAAWLAPVKPSPEETAAYGRMRERVLPFTRQLQRAIRRSLEQRRVAPRADRPFGRLDKRLTRIVTEEVPRLFSKKLSPTPRLDAALTLLVDCSASMQDKMEATKLGLTLFHEALRSLAIAHEIVGFWEDADRVTAQEAPSCFRIAVDFARSLLPGRGAAIMQLAPQQDNRDGFAIRLMTARLLQRPERQRVLLVFSDGEPSAADYHESGIVDTHAAVSEARRRGIDVVSVFLGSGGEVHETERAAMQSIYGRGSVVVPELAELPGRLAPILRKLLLKSIF
ncbi:hypothetical protein B5M42_001420 [Paenibacillus athensensis]|uniref:VWFA domain-containing protein n=1 Tax=Paenibacillus athensensis TaxID=1967502 RepID=A0A4Y8QC09_9BACL|nr:hypothetical protein [Paenibacillus athensensis]MCD1257497.1 hypothetical protein [Paenibacillus athensensis]